MKALLIVLAIVVFVTVVLNVYESYCKNHELEEPKWLKIKIVFEVASVFIFFWFLYCVSC